MSNNDLALLGASVLTIGAVCVGLAAAWYSGRRYAQTSGSDGQPVEAAPERADPATAGPEDELTAPRRHVRDRAIRIVALVFLSSVAALVALSGSWTANTAAIFLLVAAGITAVVVLQDLMPESVPEGIRHWVEAGAAIGFLTVLTGLSGGLASPFFVGFFLVVGATALSRDGLAALTLALVAGLSYGAVGLLVASNAPFQNSNLALIGFQVVALVLLAYVGTVAGREQRRAREAALRLARYDPLTGLYNRAHFFATMERELRLAERAGRGFAVLMLDLDGLKPVNDTFGHHYGDRLLQGVTEVIQHSVRATDTPARYGGDEFVILLPDTDAGGAYVVGEKLRKDIAALSIRVNDRSVRTSVSVGLVAYPEDGTTVEELMAAVDAALYEAKRSGKDRIVGYTTRTERVATRMGTAGRAQPARPSPSSPTPDPDRRDDRSSDTHQPTGPAPEGAPWETVTGSPQPPYRGSIVVGVPPGTGVRSGPRRRVAVKVEGDAEPASDLDDPSELAQPESSERR